MVRRKCLGNVELDEGHKQFKNVKGTGSNPVLTTNGDYSSVGRALDCGSRCHGFDSR